MSGNVKDVCIYIFNLLDGYTTQDYIKTAAREYLKSQNEYPLKENNFSNETFTVKRTPAGKPYFPNCKDVGFSVSHSGEYIACALTHGDVGVDIQQKQKYADESEEAFSARLCRIAERFFHPNEATLVKTEPQVRFFEVFTAKESYVKFKGTGFDETLGEISVLPEDMGIPVCHSNDEPVTWNSNDASFWQTSVGSDYTLCVCTEKECRPQIVWCCNN